MPIERDFAFRTDHSADSYSIVSNSNRDSYSAVHHSDDSRKS
jgi:hypothetical protein